MKTPYLERRENKNYTELLFRDHSKKSEIFKVLKEKVANQLTILYQAAKLFFKHERELKFKEFVVL